MMIPNGEVEIMVEIKVMANMAARTHSVDSNQMVVLEELVAVVVITEYQVALDTMHAKVLVVAIGIREVIMIWVATEVANKIHTGEELMEDLDKASSTSNHPTETVNQATTAATLLKVHTKLRLAMKIHPRFM